MGERTGHARVLVVADRDEIRTPISRALSAGGYQVDAVSSLTTTKFMDLAGYDVVLVEAKLGSARSVPCPAPSASGRRRDRSSMAVARDRAEAPCAGSTTLEACCMMIQSRNLRWRPSRLAWHAGLRRLLRARGLTCWNSEWMRPGISLRCLLDELCSFPYAESSLAVALERRTAWLLAAPLIVDAGDGASGVAGE